MDKLGEIIGYQSVYKPECCKEKTTILNVYSDQKKYPGLVCLENNDVKMVFCYDVLETLVRNSLIDNK